MVLGILIAWFWAVLLMTWILGIIAALEWLKETGLPRWRARARRG